jgi:hypothetical protein
MAIVVEPNFNYAMFPEDASLGMGNATPGKIGLTAIAIHIKSRKTILICCQ